MVCYVVILCFFSPHTAEQSKNYFNLLHTLILSALHYLSIIIIWNCFMFISLLVKNYWKMLCCCCLCCFYKIL